MSLKSSPTRYGSMAITIHWFTAIAILGMLVSGMVASNTTNDAQQLTVLRAHAIMGTLVGVLTLSRIIWFLVFDRKPRDAEDMPALQKWAAHAVHYGLYLVILVMVASGIGTLVLTGANLQLFGSAPLPLPDFSLAPPMSVHGIMSRLLIALALAHIGAALWHQFVKRDRLLARMGLGR